MANDGAHRQTTTQPVDLETPSRSLPRDGTPLRRVSISSPRSSSPSALTKMTRSPNLPSAQATLAGAPPGYGVLSLATASRQIPPSLLKLRTPAHAAIYCVCGFNSVGLHHTKACACWREQAAEAALTIIGWYCAAPQSLCYSHCSISHGIGSICGNRMCKRRTRSPPSPAARPSGPLSSLQSRHTRSSPAAASCLLGRSN